MQKAPAQRSLEERLRTVEDEQEILRTIHQYSHALAYGEQEEEFLDCFTQTAVCEPRPRHPWIVPSVGRAEGRAQLTQFYRQHAHAVSKTSTQRYFKHITGDSRITLSGDTAQVDSHYLTPNETISQDGSYGFDVGGMGRYRDRMVRCPDGRWRIQERLIEVEASKVQGKPIWEQQKKS